MTFLLIAVLAVFFWRVFLLSYVILPIHVLYLFIPWSANLKSILNAIPQNELLSDQIMQMYPFAKFTADNFKNWNVPLWNPHQGCGAPFVANDQSAVFYPFNILYWVLPLPITWSFIQIMNLFVAGFSCYIFTRSIHMSEISSIASSFSFMFSGIIIVWMGYPIVKVAVWFPLLLYFTEKLVTEGKSRIAYLLGITVGIQFLGGHIETSLHIMTATFLYFLFRVLSMRGGFKDKRRTLALFASSLIIGILLGLAQLLPFSEYLIQSQSWLIRYGPNQFYLPLKAIITLLIPNFFGNPVNNTYWGTGPNMNYNESVGGYAGIVMLFFALFAIMYRFRDKFVFFFSCLALFSISIIYNFPVVFDIITSLPLFNVTDNVRLLLILAFSISVLGGLGIDAFMKRKFNIVRLYMLAFVFLVPIFYSMAYILTLLPSEIQNLTSIISNYERSSETIRYVARDILFSLILMSILLFLLTLKSQTKIPPKVISASILMIIAINSFTFAFNYNPVVDPSLAEYPETGSIKFLLNDDSTYRILPLGWTMPPNTAMVYDLSDVRIYDAVGLKRYYEILNITGKFKGNWQITYDYRASLLNLMNVKYIMVPPNSPSLNMTLDIDQNFSNIPAGEITRSNSCGQTFLSSHNGLSAISVLMATYARNNTSSTIFHLRENINSSVDIVTIKFNNTDVRDNSWFTFHFQPIMDSVNRTFYFHFSSEDSTSGNAITAWSSSKDMYPYGQIILNRTPAEGDLTFKTFYTSTESQRFSLVYKGPDADVWRNNYFLERAFIVHRAIVILDDLQALEYMKGKSDLNFEEFAIINEEVPSEILSRLDNVPIYDKSNVTMVSYEPNKVALQAHVMNDGFLILSDNWFPGWEVYVDGKPCRIYRVDYTFRGVFLQSGNHTVEFVYNPWPFKAGTYLSLITLIITICIIIYTQRRRVPSISARN